MFWQEETASHSIIISSAIIDELIELCLFQILRYFILKNVSDF